ncbi:hypothetical protein A3I50_03610 [Candidatus Roizmanbacteria bacterium RIFCSPLOWO2_02_FULL_37_9]|nr:MAG: hypothetical protein A2859_00535 [Candidatus Roizmanbacteria bacterium RIFCSPHIGHO2_01_FULL_37_16b]OGK56281.1 MAG: hypothetical protein A3I50_03610 [Candidatus Roizmanbacteria bacterium RIFCSPLOWO2_02_FULL_37_9]
MPVRILNKVGGRSGRDPASAQNFSSLPLVRALVGRLQSRAKVEGKNLTKSTLRKYFLKKNYIFEFLFYV